MAKMVSTDLEQRNATIEDLYVNSALTAEAIGDHYQRTRQRIDQILKARGIDYADSPRWKGRYYKEWHTVMVIRVAPEVRTATLAAAQARGVSVSALINGALRAGLALQPVERAALVTVGYPSHVADGQKPATVGASVERTRHDAVAAIAADLQRPINDVVAIFLAAVLAGDLTPLLDVEDAITV